MEKPPQKPPKKPPVIAIDGPSAAGKGTLAAGLAKRYGFARLESGLLYRAVAHGLIAGGGDPRDAKRAEMAARNLDPRALRNPNLRREEVSVAASLVSEFPGVRRALLQFQRNFGAKPPGGRGAVIDGRDIGTVVFADSEYKIFLTASPRIRAARRLRQLRQSGIRAARADILRALNARDERDGSRSLAPLKRAEDAILIDSSDASAEEVLAIAIGKIGELG